MIPIGAISIILCLASGLFGEYGQYISIGGLVLAFVAMLLVNKSMKSKILLTNKESRDLIIKTIGENKFNKLLDAQKEYMDAYYESLYQEDEETEVEETKETEKTEE